MTIDLTTAKVGTKFQTRNAGIAVFEGKNPAAYSSEYPYNAFCWTLIEPTQVIAYAKFCTDSTGTYCRSAQDMRDIIAEISPSVDLSNCKFGDLVRLRNGQYAVVLVPRTSPHWVCIGMENGDTTHILRNSGHWYNDSSESPKDVVEILSSHPLAPKDYKASVTVFQKITGTRDDAQEFINRQKAKLEPREGTMVCSIKEL